MIAPSDFENGVLAAARWLRAHNHADLAGRMIRDIPTDGEGTEARTAKRIANWLGDNGFGAAAQVVASNAWRQP